MSNVNNTATASASVAFPFSTIAVVVLIIAKLQNLWGLGDLSWWWVFAPYWLPFLVFLGVLTIVGILIGLGVGISDVFKTRKAKKRAKARAALDKELANGTITNAEYLQRRRIL